jgi:hypothetical protein
MAVLKNRSECIFIVDIFTYILIYLKHTVFAAYCSFLELARGMGREVDKFVVMT